MATKSLLLVGISQNYKTVVTATGQTVQTQHIYYTTQAINEGDMLNGKVIMAVSTWYGLNGEAMGYKAVV